MSTVLPTPNLPARLTTVKGASVFMACWLALLWAVEILDTVSGGALDSFGVEPRDVGELPQILTAPLLHFGWGHLIGNSLPFFALGVLVLLSGLRRWLVATGASVASSGLLAWLLSPPASVTAGASGLIFGWLTYLLVRGIFSKDARQILLALVVFAVWGSVLWGVFPGAPGISWQAHLGGALGGLLAAWLLHSTSERRARVALPRRH